MAPRFSITAILFPGDEKKGVKKCVAEIGKEVRVEKRQPTSKVQFSLLNGIEEMRAFPD